MIAPAMNTRPEEALPYRDLARLEARITRQISLEDLPRLSTLMADDVCQPLNVVLAFAETTEGRTRVCGEVSGNITLVCNGCAEPVSHELALGFDCLIIASEALAVELGGEADVVIADGPEVTVARIVEDEILLALPERLCSSEPCERAPVLDYPAATAGEPAAREPTAGTENPFGVLAGIEISGPKK